MKAASMTVLALGGALLAGAASATVVVYNPSSGSKNDFHATFDGPVNIKQTKTGQLFVNPPPDPPYVYKSSGWSVGGAGGGNDSLTLIGLKYDTTANIGASGKARLLSWCWSIDGVCNDPDPPYVKINNVNYTLQSLNDAGYGITVPEPASWAMMIAGFGLVGATQRRRRRRTVAA